jgi:hypothetical protein
MYPTPSKAKRHQVSSRLDLTNVELEGSNECYAIQYQDRQVGGQLSDAVANPTLRAQLTTQADGSQENVVLFTRR